MRSRSLVIVLFLSQLSVAGANSVPVSKLLDQMIHHSTLAEPGAKPFYLKATITDKDDAKSEFNGTVEEYWASPTKCVASSSSATFRRRELSTAT
jgi:hypothetical protein